MLSQRTYIITGATSGMGAATARLFAAEGARLVLSGRDSERGEELVSELKAAGSEVAMHYGDVADDAVNAELVRLALELHSGLDGVVCNAGMLGLGAVTELDPEIWDRTFKTNLYSAYYLARHALPELRKSSAGVMVLNASIAADKCFPNHPAYCASKAALASLGRQMALDYGPEVRVNVINPGPVDTPLIWDSAKAFENPAEAVAAAGAATALGRLGRPEDVARLALFLVSEQSSWMTGSAVTIDGGVTLG